MYRILWRTVGFRWEALTEEKRRATIIVLLKRCLLLSYYRKRQRGFLFLNVLSTQTANWLIKDRSFVKCLYYHCMKCFWCRG